MSRPRILLADDHKIVAEALRSFLESDFDLVDIVENGIDLVERAKELDPDVIVADITMPNLNGIEAVRRLVDEGCRAKVVFLTMHHDVAYAARAFEAGASGFVLKNSRPEELVTAIHAALDGRQYVTPIIAGELMESYRRGNGSVLDPAAKLTTRQKEVLQLLVEGKSAKEIAYALSISTRTVEFHKYRMMEELEIETNAELIQFAIKNGIVAM